MHHVAAVTAMRAMWIMTYGEGNGDTPGLLRPLAFALALTT